MPQLKIRNLFISHAWTYGHAYNGLINLLDGASDFQYRDYSIPKDDPVHNATTAAALRAQIKEKISFCHAVVIMAGVYSTYSKWINIEIDITKREFSKPIVAVRPWAAKAISRAVQEAADEIAAWNTRSIVQAIRNVC